MRVRPLLWLLIVVVVAESGVGGQEPQPHLPHRGQLRPRRRLPDLERRARYRPPEGRLRGARRRPADHRRVRTRDGGRERAAGVEARADERHRIAGDARESAARVFVIFLDYYHVDVAGSRNMREPLVNALDRLLGPEDLFAVMTPEMSARDLSFARKTTTTRGMLEKPGRGASAINWLRDPRTTSIACASARNLTSPKK